MAPLATTCHCPESSSVEAGAGAAPVSVTTTTAGVESPEEPLEDPSTSAVVVTQAPASVPFWSSAWAPVPSPTAAGAHASAITTRDGPPGPFEAATLASGFSSSFAAPWEVPFFLVEDFFFPAWGQGQEGSFESRQGDGSGGGSLPPKHLTLDVLIKAADPSSPNKSARRSACLLRDQRHRDRAKHCEGQSAACTTSASAQPTCPRLPRGPPACPRASSGRYSPRGHSRGRTWNVCK